ncbi:site-specific integrase [Vibrio parahaemolyticus]|uniref:site-specific integrase n=1 Tax=Vibrio parahaemolyticus TaxID=670 RepID=UPI00146A23EA|nr:site-specific integrase [Vibrio parahaemolyticus]ELC3209336.1 site-specific integrase [Vibrio parahaemolyticus]MDF5166299.1 site-specific integrase [Vibrio parahaemolyticus]MDF5172603.1 site-specific integrase [Vibrio parahaemolyticus]MDF5678427.1 site-specific integrase [Vibrio parahaemolyticus]NMS39142.1 site-specific integrase [Vibrio parahaemolyticus]
MNELVVMPLSSDFELDGKKLPKFPFVMDKYGTPHVIINRFLREYHVFNKKNDSTTALAAARNIASQFNQLSQTFISTDKIGQKKEEEERVQNALSFMNYELDLSFDFELYGDDFHRTWLSASDALISIMLKNSEQTSPNQNSTTNRKMGDFIAFLWWAEKKKYSRWLTGINDRGIHGDNEFSVALEPKKNKYHEYSNPHQLNKEDQGRRNGYGAKKKVDEAYTKLQIKRDSSATPKEMALHFRNLLILRVMREGSLRNTEDITLELSQFEGEPEYNIEGNKVWIRTSKTKGKHKERRYVEIPTMLDKQIRRFIKMFRKQILPKALKDLEPSPTDPVFPSKKTGKALTRTSVNGIFKEYGINPHLNRMLSLSEMAMGLLKQGLGEGDILLLLSEHAGHSGKSDGSTIRKHYLDALSDLNLATMENPATLKCELSDAENEIARLKRENDELKMRLSGSASQDIL